MSVKPDDFDFFDDEFDDCFDDEGGGGFVPSDRALEAYRRWPSRFRFCATDDCFDDAVTNVDCFDDEVEDCFFKTTDDCFDDAVFNVDSFDLDCFDDEVEDCFFKTADDCFDDAVFNVESFDDCFDDGDAVTDGDGDGDAQH